MGNKHSRKSPKLSPDSPILKNSDLSSPLLCNGLSAHCPAAQLLSTISMTTTSSFTASTEKLTCTASSKKVGNGTTALLEKQGTAFRENRNFIRSFSLSSTCSNSEAAQKFSSSSTERRFSLDDALDENEEEVRPERTSSLDRLLDEERHRWTDFGLHHQQHQSRKEEVKTSTLGKMSSEERRLFMKKKVQEGISSSTSCLSKMTTYSSKGSSSKSSHSTQNLHQTGVSEVITKSPAPPKSFARPPQAPSKRNINERLDEDLELLNNYEVHSPEIEASISRIVGRMETLVAIIKSSNCRLEILDCLDEMNDLIRKSWAVSTRGYDLGSSLCNSLRNKGGLDAIMRNFNIDDHDVQFQSARLLEQCLSTENRNYVVRQGLEKIVRVAYSCCMSCSPEETRIGTGILEHLFKHSESTCQEVIRLGGLKAILYDCRTSDVETLRHCAAALANLSLHGGPENQEAMIQHKVPVWLFPLAFHTDDNIKYYACLAIAALVANKEIEAAVLQSGTLDLVEPFVTQHTPEEFARSNVAYFHGQSKIWLQKLVPVLNSKSEDAKSLAAFHFAMEAGIKKKQGNEAIFREIGAVCILKKVAASPNAIASKYAAQALQLIGEEVPHKLSQQVPLWSVEDVSEWIKQIGFCPYSGEFMTSRVDGDLLLQITEEVLKEDIGISNGILRKRFLRELNRLKRLTDYSSCDTTSLGCFMQGLGPEYCQYTYQMLQSGVTKDNLKFITEDQLMSECGLKNGIHRFKIMQNIADISKGQVNNEVDEELNPKSLDVFISYRRATGSQLASKLLDSKLLDYHFLLSLLKVHLQLRGFSVFIDVERLEAGKFDNNLVNSVRQARHFILVLTPSALDRCMGDTDCKDWVHKEIVEALKSQCNIIPILDNFQWPDPESLPEDMRAICYFNGVRWIHDYQDACVDKLERFMRGEMNVRSDGPLGRYLGMAPGTPGTPGSVQRTLPHQYNQHTPNNDSDNDSGGGNGH